MEDSYGIKAMEIARRFYLNPSHHGSVEFTKGGPIRLKHRNLGLIQGLIIGFEEHAEGNKHRFHINLADGENFKVALNNYGYYGTDGPEDRLGVLLLSTATEREETDFSTVRVQNTFPEKGVFCILNQSHQEFVDTLEDMREMDFAWIIDREVIKSLFQLHDVLMIRFTATIPATGEFDAEMFCPGYKLEVNYRHLESDLNVNLIDLKDQAHWSVFLNSFRQQPV